MKPRGWTLIEMLVVVGLMGLLAACIALMLSGILRSSREEMARSHLQSLLMVAMNRLERTLQRSCLEGLSYVPGPPALLAVHTQPEGVLPRVPVWDPFWVTFLWHEGRLLMRSSPPHPALTAPSIQGPRALAEPQLSQVLASPLQHSRLLAENVSLFRVDLGHSGSVEFELELQRPTRNQAEKFRARRRLFLRNSS